MNEFLAHADRSTEKIHDSQRGTAQVSKLISGYLGQVKDFCIRELGASVREEVASEDHELRHERPCRLKNRPSLVDHSHGDSFGRRLLYEKWQIERVASGLE